MRRQKYYSAGFICLLGAATALGSLKYGLGTLARMGPGYFPLMLGAVLVFIGLIIAVTPNAPDQAHTEAERSDTKALISRHLRPWSAVVGGMIAFILLGHYGGLVPATFALIFIAALGDRSNSVQACFWLAIGVVAFAVVAFHYGLRLQFPLFQFALWN